MKVQIDVEEKELYFMNVPEMGKKFVVENYGFANTWLIETGTTELNSWKTTLPKGYKYEVLGFVIDVINGEITSDKNFVLRRVIL